MEYKLKKDLPFAKAGTRVDEILHRRGNNTLSFIRIGDCKCYLDANKAHIFDWIEEVKPREWWLGVNDVDDTSFPVIDRKDIGNGYDEYIKVTEVIE